MFLFDKGGSLFYLWLLYKKVNQMNDLFILALTDH